MADTARQYDGNYRFAVDSINEFDEDNNTNSAVNKFKSKIIGLEDLNDSERDKKLQKYGVFGTDDRKNIDPSKFDDCNEDPSKKYCIGVSVKYKDLSNSATEANAINTYIYTINVYCWEVDKGDNSLIQSSTQVSIDKR